MCKDRNKTSFIQRFQSFCCGCNRVPLRPLKESYISQWDFGTNKLPDMQTHARFPHTDFKHSFIATGRVEELAVTRFSNSPVTLAGSQSLIWPPGCKKKLHLADKKLYFELLVEADEVVPLWKQVMFCNGVKKSIWKKQNLPTKTFTYE